MSVYKLVFLIFLIVLRNFCAADHINCSNTEEVKKYLEELEKNQTALFSYYANITKEENIADMFQDIEALKDTSLTIDDILPANKSLYLKRRPPTVCGRPAKVIHHITVMSLDSINEAAMTYSLDVYLTVCWIDHRLRFPETARAYRILDPTWLGNVWQPDIIFKNAREVTFHQILVPNHYLWMLPNKALVYVAKLTLILTCVMDFTAYPHDTQECDLRIESMTYTNKELVNKWDDSQPMTFNTKDKDNRIQTPQFRSVYNKTAECTAPYLTGAYSCIKAVFYLRRRLGYHLIHTYFPSGLIVILSWVTFWIKPRDIAARIGLGVTSLLTLATLSTQSQESLPPVSYGKAIDIWMTCCALFVFCSILEFAVVNYLVCRFPENDNETDLKNDKTWKSRMRNYFNPHRVQITAHNIDRLSRMFFPTCFMLLNMWYWRKYLQDDKIDGNKLEDYDY